MKTKWEYRFETDGFVFPKKYSFLGQLNSDDENYLSEGYPSKFDFNVQIEPNEKKKSDPDKQFGKLFLTVPFRYNKAKGIVNHILYKINTHINFEFGKFKIHGGFISGERIPDTDEEEVEIGEEKYFIHMVLETVPQEKSFSPKTLIDSLQKNADSELMVQYNHANNCTHPITKFVEFYKIIEDTYSKNFKGEIIKKTLKKSDLKSVYETVCRNEDLECDNFEDFIDKIVDSRNKCSHLKNKRQFGYLPNDSRLENEVEPFIFLLKRITHEIIVNTAT